MRPAAVACALVLLGGIPVRGGDQEEAAARRAEAAATRAESAADRAEAAASRTEQAIDRLERAMEAAEGPPTRRPVHRR